MCLSPEYHFYFRSYNKFRSTFKISFVFSDAEVDLVFVKGTIILAFREDEGLIIIVIFLF
jgi:hypothetical protein